MPGCSLPAHLRKTGWRKAVRHTSWWCLARKQGSRSIYGHFDLLLGQRATTEVFPEIARSGCCGMMRMATRPECLRSLLSWPLQAPSRGVLAGSLPRSADDGGSSCGCAATAIGNLGPAVSWQAERADPRGEDPCHYPHGCSTRPGGLPGTVQHLDMTICPGM